MRTIGLISPGDMGQAVGALLVEGGVRVVTCVSGRSDRTRALARSAGFTEVPTLDFEDVGLTPLIVQSAAEIYRITARLEIGGERLEIVDRFRGVDGTVEVLARASEKVPTK